MQPPGRSTKRLSAVAAMMAVLLAGCGSSGGHSATRGPMESIFQDDQLVLYSPAPAVASTLDTLRGLGVDRIRVTVLWQAIAPDPASPVAPRNFNAADPAAYPATGWEPYDRLASLAATRGIGLDFNVTAPGPLWAMSRAGASAKYASHYRPSAAAFGQFVAAVGKRYSGSFIPAGDHRPLPRIAYWTIWNEPNQPGWLAPQWGPGAVPQSPVLYRSYLDASFAALKRTGHGTSTDTFLIGELAPEGTETTATEAPMPPIPFLRSLYCVGSSYQPLRGARAGAVGCPTGGSPSAFANAHPALFQPSGFAHHPYSFFLPPATSLRDPDFAPISDLGRLEHALDQIFSAYGVHRQLPIYLTEYGYETNPPDPFRGVPLQKQALYVDQAQYMAWKDPRVRAMAQFLLVDSAPNKLFPPGSIGYWATFQTGLELLGGAHKPSYAAYRLPLFVPDPSFKRGGSLLVWGMLRPAHNGTTQSARIQWSSGTGAFKTLASVQTSDPSGFLSTEVRPPASGAVRIEWVSPSGARIRSRTAAIEQR